MKKRRKVVTLLIFLLLLVSVFSLTAEAEAKSKKKKKQTETTQTEAVQTEITHYYFRNQKLLDQHYEKHGMEMGFDSAEDYEEAACAVVNNPECLHKIEKEDGDDVYYLEETNDFVIVSTDGYIRTYFWPSAGIKYYNKQ